MKIFGSPDTIGAHMGAWIMIALVRRNVGTHLGEFFRGSAMSLYDYGPQNYQAENIIGITSAVKTRSSHLMKAPPQLQFNHEIKTEFLHRATKTPNANTNSHLPHRPCTQRSEHSAFSVIPPKNPRLPPLCEQGGRRRAGLQGRRAVRRQTRRTGTCASAAPWKRSAAPRSPHGSRTASSRPA